ncbi:SDR family NAD(P)-dependent oxidoreductase [Saccharopolyspora phatthalungensis]|uniref:NAD(P)-dependent dehydrogenase (Short-subunit alcohol dehydrogenase family) n=1 Tax=Saccharopolyspora phatthalungensis TaxID=664693 RepID=A0A840QIW8_9PSEU|nr:SDR family NAD(P)-dependent oxidoreductase [Saccharopolyspora phatthalungensis]MBB5158878.1 NAD(P)-dependent dehydrogenase (short-subunit alcohol dehydrogenase family) [Saccharopolyspora phatthalungensis]
MTPVASSSADNHHPRPITIEASRLQGKVIVITGASAGIGAAAARRFAAEGAHVALLARREDRLKQVVAELEDAGQSALALQADVADESSVRAAVTAVVDHFGRLDGAFNNAGVLSEGKPLHQSSSEHFRHVLDVNLLGVYYCLKYEIPALMEAGGGSIVNTSSVGGLMGAPIVADYVASKWGVIGLTKTAALECGPANIRVNAIAPGPTRTDMLDIMLPTEEAKAAAVAGWSPMNHIALPDDVARVALYLLSDEARWTTGAVLPVDGGQHVGQAWGMG